MSRLWSLSVLILLLGQTAGAATEVEQDFDLFGILLIALGMLLTCVVVHYEGFAVLTRLIGRLEGRRRPRILVLILSLFALHLFEVLLYAAVYTALGNFPSFGDIEGLGRRAFADAAYFSLVTYTTVGFGDLVPTGPMRLLAGSEALTGFVLITWSASFTFYEMERLWRS